MSKGLGMVAAGLQQRRMRAALVKAAQEEPDNGEEVAAPEVIAAACALVCMHIDRLLTAAVLSRLPAPAVHAACCPLPTGP